MVRTHRVWGFLLAVALIILLSGCQTKPGQPAPAIVSEGPPPLQSFLEVGLSDQVKKADYEAAMETWQDTVWISLYSLIPEYLSENDLRERIQVKTGQGYLLSVTGRYSATIAIGFGDSDEIKMVLVAEPTEKEALYLPRDLVYTFHRVEKRTVAVSCAEPPGFDANGSSNMTPGEKHFTFTFSHPVSPTAVTSQLVQQLKARDCQWTGDTQVTFVHDVVPGGSGSLMVEGLVDVRGVPFEFLPVHIWVEVDLPVVLVNGPDEAQVLTHLTNLGTRISIAPDGTQMAYAKLKMVNDEFSSHASLWLKDLASGDDIFLLPEVSYRSNEIGVLWHPDSRHFWIAEGNTFLVDGGRGKNVYLGDRAGHLQAIPLNLPPQNSLDACAVSPKDGSLVLRVIDRDPAREEKDAEFSYWPLSVWVYSADGLSVKKYPNIGYERTRFKPNMCRPIVHPDGRSVTVQGWQKQADGSWAGDLIEVDLETGQVTLRQGSPAALWSPTGDYYLNYWSGDWTVFSSAGQPVAPFPNSYDHTWSPDGQRLAYYEYNEQHQLFVYDLRSGSKTTWFHGAVPLSPQWTQRGLIVVQEE